MRPAGAVAVRRRAFFGALAGVPLLGMQSQGQSAAGNAHEPMVYAAARDIAPGEDLMDMEGRVIGHASCRYGQGCLFRSEDVFETYRWRS